MSWEYLLTNKDITLETKYEISKYISNIMKNDWPILYLSSYEIGRIFNGEVKSFHEGFLITIGTRTAILLEHGSSLLNSENSNSIIANLSSTFSQVVLASCYSNILSKYNPNIFGFSGEVTIEIIIDYLAHNFHYKNYELNNLLESKLRAFKLSVYEADFIVNAGSNVDQYIQQLILLNHEDYQIFNPKVITLREGNDQWGVIHINKKPSCYQYLSNMDLETVLKNGIGIIFPDKIENMYKLVMYKLEYVTEMPYRAWRMIAILIALEIPPSNIHSPPGTYYSYTIRSADLWNKLNRNPISNPVLDIDNAKNKDIKDYLEDHWNVNPIINSPSVQLPNAFSTIPYTLADINLDYLLGIESPVEIPKISPEDWLQINEWLNGIGNSINEYINNLDKAQLWAIRLCLLIVVVMGILLALPTDGLSLSVSGLALLGLFVSFGIKTININPNITFPLPPPRFIDNPSLTNSIDSIYLDSYSNEEDYYKKVLSIDEEISDNSIEKLNFTKYLDDDNDGISNIIESSYFKICIDPTLSGETFGLISDGSPYDEFTSNDNRTWMDPNIDYDNDGLLTITEILYGSNPFIIDSDYDGLNDNEEIYCTGTSSIKSVRLTDNNEDGLLDIQQITIQGDIELKSNPLAFDSDCDGLGDCEEKHLELNAFNRDTDNDSLLDGWEVYTYAVRWENSPNENYDYYMDFVNPLYSSINPINWAAEDTDSDGLNNSMESILFTNPYSSDSDNDSLSDIWEFENNFDPTNSYDGAYDHDGDSLSSASEVIQYGTFWNDNDTDDDGLLDGEEVAAGDDGFITNPLDADTDADGIDDYEEVFIGTDGYVTDPTKWDTDDDFMSDGYEITNNLDPTDDDFDDDGLLDGEELLIYHSDPTKTDTDNDGLNDYTEVFTYNTDPADADSDNDGLSDKEEVLLLGDGYITNPNDPDSDDDGLLDGEEYTHGSNPNDSDTDGDYIPDGEEVIAGTDGYETDPTKWDTDGDGMDDFSEINNGLDPTFNDAAVDSDNDDLNNLEEFYLGTDPYDSDSDNDGMKDGWEATYSLNPLSDDAMADADGDGLKNIDEYLYDCNPRDTDSDNDGLNDKLEVVTYGTDPNDSDTDNDGWSDYYEVYTSGTSPTKADTDGDGIADKTEYYWWINTYGQSSTSAKSKIKIKDVDGDRLSDGYEKSHNYNPLDSDMDNDGLSDGDEVCTYHTDPKDSDSDNDGYSDLTELINGTDPNDSSDYPGSGGGGGGGWIP